MHADDQLSLSSWALIGCASRVKIGPDFSCGLPIGDVQGHFARK